MFTSRSCCRYVPESVGVFETCANGIGATERVRVREFRAGRSEKFASTVAPGKFAACSESK